MFQKKLFNDNSISQTNLRYSHLNSYYYDTEQIKNLNKNLSFITIDGTLVQDNGLLANKGVLRTHSIYEFLLNGSDGSAKYDNIKELLNPSDDEYMYHVTSDYGYNELWKNNSTDGIELLADDKSLWTPGSVVPIQQMNGELILRRLTTASGSTRQILTNIPQLKNFILSIDILLINDNNTSYYDFGILFRNTTFYESDGTGGYYVYITSSNRILFAKGSNSSTPQWSGWISSNLSVINDIKRNWHNIKIYAIDSNIKVYVNNILALDITDTTYTQQGYIALKFGSVNYSGTTANEVRFRNLKITNLDDTLSNKHIYNQFWSQSNNDDNYGPLTRVSGSGSITSSGGTLKLSLGSSTENVVLLNDVNVIKDINVSINTRVTNVRGTYTESQIILKNSNNSDISLKFSLKRDNTNKLYVSYVLSNGGTTIQSNQKQLSSLSITEDVNKFYTLRLYQNTSQNTVELYVNNVLFDTITSQNDISNVFFDSYKQVYLGIYSDSNDNGVTQTVEFNNLFVNFAQKELNTTSQKFYLYNFSKDTSILFNSNNVIELSRTIKLLSNKVYNFSLIGYIPTISNVEKIECLITNTSGTPITPQVKTELYEKDVVSLQGYQCKITSTGDYNLIIRIHPKTQFTPSQNYVVGNVFISDPSLIELDTFDNLQLPFYTNKTKYPFFIGDMYNQLGITQNESHTMQFVYKPFTWDTKTINQTNKELTLFSLGQYTPSIIREQNNPSSVDYVTSTQFFSAKLISESNTISLQNTYDVDNILINKTTNVPLKLVLTFRYDNSGNITTLNSESSSINIPIGDLFYKKHVVVYTYSQTTKTYTVYVIFSNGQYLSATLNISSYTLNDAQYTFNYLSPSYFVSGSFMLGAIIDITTLWNTQNYKFSTVEFTPIQIQNQMFSHLLILKNYTPISFNTDICKLGFYMNNQRQNSNLLYDTLLI